MPRTAAASKKAAAPRTAAASKKAPARQKSTASKKAPPPSPLPKLLGILESQKQLGGASYPPTIARLAELAGDKPTATIKALITEEAKARVLLSRDAEGRKKPPPGTVLVLLKEDLQTVAQSDRLLEVQLQSARKPDAPAVDLAQLPKGLLPALGRAFKAALDQRLAERRIPRTIGALTGKKPLFFFLADAVLPAADSPARPATAPTDGAPRPTAPRGARTAPADPADAAPTDAPSNGVPAASLAGAPAASLAGAPAPAPAAPFAARFDAAFTALDRVSGGNNYVTLRALRAALPDVPRATFDAELAALRRQRRYSLDPSDGRHHQMAEAEREAGILEAGNLLVYVARRHDA
ncbi:hypothetical protein WMF26_00760 [Sorangium sp. So ce185]|uniref:hypothetical protein n=1 Tax=Sorangium sp. So ce185 TaxID=3133287 RepID=UPI003F60E9F6